MSFASQGQLVLEVDRPLSEPRANSLVPWHDQRAPSAQGEFEGPCKRRRFSHEERSRVLQTYKKCNSKMECVRVMRKVSGYEKLTRSMLNNWLQHKVTKKMGRPVLQAFEASVIDECVVKKVSTVVGVEQLEVAANSVYSYAVVAEAARRVKQQPEWQNNAQVQALKLSSGWIHDMLQRAGLIRRRCTTIMKKRPSQEVVDLAMSKIQAKIVEYQITPDRIVNTDETSIDWAVNPRYQYVFDSARGTSPPDSAGRFTAHLGVLANGKRMPLFLILKVHCACQCDLRSSTSLDNLLNKGFLADSGWVKHEFQWKNRLTGQVFYRPYLIRPNLDIITVQQNGSMHEVGIIMWIRLQLTPFRSQRGGGTFLQVLDNCSVHKTACVQEEFGKSGWQVAYLPPNVTDIAQPVDLCVNAAVKARLRELRVRSILSYMREWKEVVSNARINGNPSPPFHPPAPTLIVGVTSMINVWGHVAKFEDSIARTFVDVGLAPTTINANGEYGFGRLLISQRLPSSRHRVLPSSACVASMTVNVASRADSSFDGEDEDSNGTFVQECQSSSSDEEEY